MKFRKSDLTVEDFERGRKKSELKQVLDEFIAMESDVVVIDPKENGYSRRRYCKNSRLWTRMGRINFDNPTQKMSKICLTFLFWYDIIIQLHDIIWL